MAKRLHVRTAILWGLVFLITSCSSISKVSKDESLKSQDLSDTDINDWKQDDQGCLRKRTHHLADTLLERYNLHHGTSNEIERVFGKPNEVKERNNGITIWVYYFSSICRDGKIEKEEADFCFAEFYFKSGVLFDVSYTCH